MEYGWYISEYPTWEFIRPKEFRQRYIEGTLDKFDAIFTYSSVEHSGLGKKNEILHILHCKIYFPLSFILRTSCGNTQYFFLILFLRILEDWGCFIVQADSLKQTSE